MTAPGEANQAEIDDANRAFWNELCGSQVAKSLGIAEVSEASLKKFDDWYFDFYPYLFTHIPFARLEGQWVLEVGLGYATVAQRIAEAGAEYHGLDIAPGPVAMARDRLGWIGRQGTVRQGSVLDCPYDKGYFDRVIAIGCLHHTGNMAKGIEEVYRVLKPGGCAMIMVYNAASYRRWAARPWATLKRVFAPVSGHIDASEASERLRAAYDASLDGSPAPHTEFVTNRELRRLCQRFRSCRITRENIGAEGFLRFVPRPVALKYLGPTLGLDLYCHLEK